jgi:hypothetical protein
MNKLLTIELQTRKCMDWNINTEMLFEQTKSFSVGGSPLVAELNKISSLSTLNIPEAIAFYAGRILEAMVAQVVSNEKLPVGAGGVNSNLDILSKHGKIDEGTLSIANAIRRYSNQARHLERTIHIDEASTIVGLLQLWLEWFEHAARIKSGKQENVEQFKLSWSIKTDLFRKLAYSTAEVFDEYFQQEQQKVLLSEAAIAEFAAERYVNCRSVFADDFTDKIIKTFPRSTRAKQMRALYYSRNHNPGGAIVVLTNLAKHNKWPDDEFFGILGGAYKNKWIATGDALFLKEAHGQYENGVRHFSDNYYLRINLAGTSLWMGDLGSAVAHAKATLKILSEYGFAINPSDSCKGFDYYVVATMAEAHLLAGEVEPARDFYELAIKMVGEKDGRWLRTAEQLVLHLKYISDSATTQSFAGLAGKV